MLVSVITVCYNSEKTVRKAIESVLSQTYPEIEYIIVDGASGDNTIAVAKDYEDRFREKGYRYRIISEKDNGIYDAMNKGIRTASGELIGMVNSDDWYEPIAVETAVRAYKEVGYDVFYADVNVIKDDGSIFVKHSKYDSFPSTRHWNHPTTFITKAAYEEQGLYRCKTVYDDLDMLLRMRRAGKKIEIRNVVLSNFRTGGASNQKSLKKCFQRMGIRYECYRSNGYNPLCIFECVAIELAKFLLG